jgi:ATP/maltotriose-dependent transcriptional regulator MalT
VLAFCEQWGLAPIYAACRLHYARVLTWQGNWNAAEGELNLPRNATQHPLPGLERQRQIRLAELRRRQGRLEEAEQLLGHAGEDPLAIIGYAAVSLDRDEWELARELSDRALRLLPADAWIDRVDALLIHGRAVAALGDAAGATAAALEIGAAATRAGTASLRGTAAYARGVAALAGEDAAAAVTQFEEAVTQSDRGGAPYEAAQARLELAAALGRLGRRQAAEREARKARDAFTALGAMRDRARADAFLRAPASPAPESAQRLTSREVEILRLVARGWSNRRIAAELLLSAHTVKRHVANVLRKLEAPSRAAAVSRGTRLGILP